MHHCVCLSGAHQKRRPPFAKSLEGVAPEIAAQWHPTLNGTITPRDVYSQSNQKVWWKCHCSTRDCSAVASHSEWDHHTQ